MTDEEAKAQLCALVSPWLSEVSVISLEIQTSCQCYSEWTTDDPHFWVQFRARHDDEKALSKIVSALEPLVKQWALANYSFSGCSCCQGEDAVDGDAEPSVWVRVTRIGSEN
jgi:hypothetical protein